MSADLTSAVFRVFALAELLEQILLSSPERKDCLPEFQYFVQQRVSKGFRATINSSSPILRRMCITSADEATTESRYRMTEWISERGILPPLLTSSYRRAEWDFVRADIPLRPSPKPEPESKKYMFAPTAFYLEDMLRYETEPSPGAAIGYTLIRAHASRAQSEVRKFSFPNASWRKLPLHPSMKAEAVWTITLIDSRGRLSDGRKRCRLVLRFDFGGEVVSGRLGELFDLVEGIKSRTAEEHIRCQKHAMKNSLKAQQEALRELVKKDSVAHAQH